MYYNYSVGCDNAIKCLATHFCFSNFPVFTTEFVDFNFEVTILLFQVTLPAKKYNWYHECRCEGGYMNCNSVRPVVM